MSALFMSHHRYSTINPEDIARFGGKRPSLNSIAFRSDIDFDSDSESDNDKDIDKSSIYQPVATYDAGDEEKSIGIDRSIKGGSLKRQTSSRRSTKSMKKHSFLNSIYRKWKRLYRKFGFRHIIPILLLIAYSFVGALIFQAIESPHAQMKRQGDLEMLENNRKMAAKAIMTNLRLTRNNTESRLLKLLQEFERNNSLPAKETITWDLWGSLYFCGTIFTTVGYGNIYPQTSLGWAVTMIYAFFGVPLLLAILSDIGQLMCFWMNFAWRWFKERLSPEEKGKAGSESSIDPLIEVFGESGAPEPGLPVILALAITFSWIFMCSAMFCLWESDWSYFTAFYFCFISFTTIGLGDVIPEDPMLMVLNSGFLIIGLCLVSMTIGVVQEHIELFLYRVMMALQKECEQLLAAGEDVEKQALVKKIWDKQPWYIKRLMPALMGGANSKRLNEFAGAAITDTAVQMGIIPPPPGYRRSTPLGRGPFPPMSLSNPNHPPDAGQHQPTPDNLNPESIVIRPPRRISDSLVKASADLVRPFVPKIATVLPQKRQPEGTEFLPGGRAIVRRPKSTSLTDGKMDQALRWRTMSTQTMEISKSTVMIQTEVIEAEVMKETISIGSWSDPDDVSIGRPLIPVTDTDNDKDDKTGQNDLTAKEIVLKMETLSNMSLASWDEDGDPVPTSPVPVQAFAVQEIFHFDDVGQQTVKVSSYEDPKSVAVQTDPLISITIDWHDDVSSSLDDFQSVKSTNLSLTSVPIKEIDKIDKSTQCDIDIDQRRKINKSIDQAVQTAVYIHLHEKIDKSTQSEKIDIDQIDFQQSISDSSTQYDEISICENGAQTESISMVDVENQTNFEQSIKDEAPKDELKEETKTDQRAPTDVSWSYKTWYNERRGQYLDIVPEEESDEDLEEEVEDEEGSEENTSVYDIGTSPMELNSYQSKSGTNFIDRGVQTENLKRRSSKLNEQDKDVMTAAFATQTDDEYSRRSFAKINQAHAEAMIRNRHGGTFKEKWSAWKERRHAKRHPEDKRNAAVQTEARVGDGVRDIVCQTDDSYLRIATKLNQLRHNRAKSLKVTAISPKTKQRLTRYANANAAAGQ